MWNKYKWAIIIGGILVLAIIGGVIENQTSLATPQAVPKNGVQQNVFPTPATQAPLGVSLPKQISIADILSIADAISTSSGAEQIALAGTVTKIWPDNEFEINDGSGNALIQISDTEQNIEPIMAQLVAGDKVSLIVELYSAKLAGYTLGWYLNNDSETYSVAHEPLAFADLPTNTFYLSTSASAISILSPMISQTKPQATWHTAFAYNGNGSTQIINTKDFFLRGSQWKLTYSCDTPVIPGNFDVLFRAEPGSVQNVESVPSEIQDSNCPDGDTVYDNNQYPGYYSLSIYPQGAFTITVQDYY